MKKIIIVLLVALGIGGVSCDRYNKLLKSSDYELKLKKALEYYNKGNYVRASQLYEELIPVMKGTDKSEEVYYYYTWSEYNMGDYILAQYHFKNFTRQFFGSKHAEECYFMNAYCYYLTSPNYQLDQTATKNAIQEFQAFADAYPSSERLDSCNRIIDKLRAKIEHKESDVVKQYYKIQDYKATITATKNFVKEYPNSTYTEEMYYMMINSYYLLAINSIQEKKQERLDGAIESYLKFVDLYPQSRFLSRAESVYASCKEIKDKSK
ncbi:MAG: outer membrane protein assembly factor BamD [Sediminibacterium sp.]|nr:outer membrane protein assembly factor BamD [Sediminibacterium sp.]